MTYIQGQNQQHDNKLSQAVFCVCDWKHWHSREPLQLNHCSANCSYNEFYHHSVDVWWHSNTFACNSD